MSNKPIKIGDYIKAPQDIEAYVTQADPAIRVVMNHPDFCLVQSIWDSGRKATLVVGGHAVSVHIDKL